MTTFSRILSVLLIVTGVAVLVLGAGAGLAGIGRMGAAGRVGVMPFGGAALPALSGLLIVAAVFVESLTLMGLGAGLWLLADLVQVKQKETAAPKVV